MPTGHYPRKYLADRIASSVLISSDECWIWTKSRSPMGYGRISVGGRNGGVTGAHRASWIAFRGEIPEGLFVCHKCDNPPCCNPDHLFLGTTTDNMRDMISKGRGNWTVTNNGSKNGNSKLTDDVVRTILSIPYDEALRRRHEFQVTRQNIRFIHKGLTWKHIERTHANLECPRPH